MNRKTNIFDQIKSILMSARLKLSNSFSSGEYWENRYNQGSDSGDGSYGQLAKFKADILNEFVKDNDIQTIIEFGCGDGNQLLLANYPHYIGFDISAKAISMCEEIFARDNSKTFKLAENYTSEDAELSLSLDVAYHLIEDSIYEGYMRRLFESSRKFVIVFSSNTNQQRLIQAPHVKHRKVTSWVKHNAQNWKLIKQVPNEFAYSPIKQTGSFADFFIFQKLDT